MLQITKVVQCFNTEYSNIGSEIQGLNIVHSSKELV